MNDDQKNKDVFLNDSTLSQIYKHSFIGMSNYILDPIINESKSVLIGFSVNDTVER